VLPDVSADGAEAVTEPLKPRDAAKHSGLAAPGRPKEGRDSCGRDLERRIKGKPSQRAAECNLDDVRFAHSPARATRFSISIMDRMTANAKTTMPAAR